MAVLGLKAQTGLWFKFLSSKPDTNSSAQLAHSKENPFLQVGFRHYGSSCGLRLDLCKCSVVHYLLTQLVKNAKAVVSTELGILFTLAQDSQGTGLRGSHFRGPRLQTRQQLLASGFCINLPTTGPAVSLLICKWMTGQGGSRYSLQDRDSMRNPLPLSPPQMAASRQTLSKCCSPNQKENMTSSVSERTLDCSVCVSRSHRCPLSLPVSPPCHFSSSCSFSIQAPITSLTLSVCFYQPEFG